MRLKERGGGGRKEKTCSSLLSASAPAAGRRPQLFIRTRTVVNMHLSHSKVTPVKTLVCSRRPGLKLSLVSTPRTFTYSLVQEEECPLAPLKSFIKQFFFYFGALPGLLAKSFLDPLNHGSIPSIGSQFKQLIS